MELNPAAQEKIRQLQMLEQNMQQIHAQKQQLQNNLFEIENALKELNGAKESYKVIGTIMVAKTPSALKTELESKKELNEIRISSLEKQEMQFKEKAEKMQEEFLQGMKK